MRFVLRRLLLATTALALGLLGLPAAHALSSGMRSVEATEWSYLYAGAATGTTSSAGAANATANNSSFTVNYSLNFPPAARSAFDKAIEIWSTNFNSNVPIVINASWSRLSTGVLGSAQPTKFFSNFDNSPSRDLWYTSAMANSLAGRDLDPSGSDINANFSSGAPWSFNTNGVAQRGYYDFVTVALHELGHGLGLLSAAYLNPTGTANNSQPTPFDAFARPLNSPLSLADYTNDDELARALVAPMTWIGTKGIAANNGVAPKLYSPSSYEAGSSTSHLDEETFGNTKNALMTPVLDAGEVIYDPGPVVLGMFADMLGAPPAPSVTTAPLAPKNAAAITGDQSAIVTFDPPTNNRNSQVENYTVEVVGGALPPITTKMSPVLIPGLRAGSSYVFTVRANNSVGSSPLAYTNSVLVSKSWKLSVIDPSATGTYVASAVWRAKSVIAYTDATSGDLKLAVWNGKSWSISTVDGDSNKNGRTTNDVSGAVSVCVSGVGTKQVLHIFYSDLISRDLRHASYDGRSYLFETVDGDAPSGQAVEDPSRTRTNSDVSIANACASTVDGLQVFYRDETLGILLGAVKKGPSWRYEIIDGDRDSDGRTTGDVAFRIRSVTSGRTVHLIYDSVRLIDAQRNPTSGDVRYAKRTGTVANSWRYLTVEASNSSYPVAGYDLAIGFHQNKLYAAWLAATPSIAGPPVPDSLKFAQITNTGTTTPRVILPNAFGNPQSPLSIRGTTVAYGCQARLCTVDALKSGDSRALVTGRQVSKVGSATWIQLTNGKTVKTGIVLSVNGALALLSK